MFLKEFYIIRKIFMNMFIWKLDMHVHVNQQEFPEVTTLALNVFFFFFYIQVSP